MNGQPHGGAEGERLAAPPGERDPGEGGDDEDERRLEDAYGFFSILSVLSILATERDMRLSCSGRRGSGSKASIR